MRNAPAVPQIVLATYYSVPVVSFRAATWGPVWTRKEANFTVDDLMRDWHPNTRGHQCARWRRTRGAMLAYRDAMDVDSLKKRLRAHSPVLKAAHTKGRVVLRPKQPSSAFIWTFCAHKLPGDTLRT